MNMFIKNLKLFILGFILFLNFLVWYVVFIENGNDKLYVSFLDVGQGDAIFIDSPSGNQVLIDGGPDRSVERGLSNVLPFYDRKINLLVVSNPDKDHIVGLINILDKYKVEAVLEPGTLPDTGVYESFQKAIEKSGAKHFIAKRGMKINLGNDVFLRVLFPDHDVSEAKTNDGSLVARLEYGGNSVLFTGDMPSTIEKYLLSLGGNLKSDILKVGHHGSRTSTSETFLGFVQPKFSVISSGFNNSYGHPHKETLDRLLQFGSQIFNTASLGIITFISDGENFVKK